VIVLISGHGVTDNLNSYYFVPYDARIERRDHFYETNPIQLTQNFTECRLEKLQLMIGVISLNARAPKIEFCLPIRRERRQKTLTSPIFVMSSL